MTDRSVLIKRLDKLVSEQVRKERCFLCGGWPTVAAHLIGRRNLRYRWDRDNVKPMCRWCHDSMDGRMGTPAQVAAHNVLRDQHPHVWEWWQDNKYKKLDGPLLRSQLEELLRTTELIT